MKLSRRKILKGMGHLGAISFVDPTKFYPLTRHLSRPLGYLANRSTTTEGQWDLTDIEGQLPDDLRGRLLRVAPGSKEVHGIELNHLFDGDAYISELTIDQDRVSLRAQFLRTPKREEEARQGQMLYTDFGTQSPGRFRDHKEPPNINVIPFGPNKLLALPESTRPMSFRWNDFSYIGTEDFAGTWPSNVSFSAHPKLDPMTGNIFSYGTKQGFGMNLQVFEVDSSTGRARKIFDRRQDRAYIIHDMAMTKNYLIFVINPFYMNVRDLIISKKTMAESMRFNSSSSTRILVVPKTGEGQVHEFEAPSFLSFHHGNAFESGPGSIVLDSFAAGDGSSLRLLENWREYNSGQVLLPTLTRFELQLSTKKVSMSELSQNCGLPCIDPDTIGSEQDFVYMNKILDTRDPAVGHALSKYQFSSADESYYLPDPGEALGEPVFVKKTPTAIEDDGYLLAKGYSSLRDETFLEILDTRNMNRVARVWFGHFQPLGFHGMFVADV